MELEDLRSALQRGLEEEENAIIAHIEQVERDGRAGGIEAIFAKSFHDRLPFGSFECEISLDRIRTQNYFGDREKGRVDFFIPTMNLAIEYKAIRLPRIKGDALFDLCQLSADYLRLSRAERLEDGYVVAFVYGPLTADRRDWHLYNHFHNQMFIDYRRCIKNGRSDLSRYISGIDEMGLTDVWEGAELPADTTVIRSNRLGAICIPCFGS